LVIIITFLIELRSSIFDLFRHC